MSKQILNVLMPAAFIALVLLIGVVSPAAAQSEGQIGGIVYIDNNGNGIREEGEEGLNDVEVTFDSGGWETTLNTASNGAFSLAANPATWTVSVAPPAGYTAPKSSVEVFIEKPGDAVTNVEFGLVPAEEGGEVLPAGGAPVSSLAFIGGLFGLLVVGMALVAYGQIRSKQG